MYPHASVVDFSYSIPGHPSEPSGESPVIILKLHDSCKWALRHEQDQSLHIDYKFLFFDQLTAEEDALPIGYSADLGYSLIVPSYLKNPTSVPILRNVWESAEEALKKAKNIIVLGYSLPDADSHSQRLFRKAIHRNANLESIELVLGNNRDFPMSLPLLNITAFHKPAIRNNSLWNC
jgi:hypothetical protein